MRLQSQNLTLWIMSASLWVARNSDRDTWKLENWDEYIAGCDFSIPEELEALSEEKNLFIFENSDDREFHESMAKVTAFLES